MTQKPDKAKPPQSTVADAPRHTAWSVAQTCGVTTRQLQWWDEQGIVSPIIIDHKRMYTDAELEKVRRIGELKRAGIQPRKAHRYLSDRWEYTSIIGISRPTVIKGVLVIPR